MSTTSWFPPQEPAECAVCHEARAALSPEGLALAGDLAVRLIASGQVVALLEAAVASLAAFVGPGRVAVLVPEIAGKWRVFTSSSGSETLDVVIDSDCYAELSEARRTGAPPLVPAVEHAPELRVARSFLAAAGVRGLAAFPIFRATVSNEPVVLKLSFRDVAKPSQIALAILIAHQLVHRLARLPQGDVASQLGIPLPPTEASDPRSLLRLLPLPAAVIDAEGRIVHANPRATWLLLGRDAATSDEQVLGLRPERPWLVRGSRWEAKLTTGTAELPVLGWSSQVGTERFLVLLEPHPEARRREHGRRIRRTLAEKLRELETANVRLAEHARARGRFVSDAAHELKTLLAIMRSYLETLGDDLSDGLTAQQHEFIAAATHGTQRLQRLIDELLDLAALDSGHLPLSLGMVASRDVVQAVTDELQPLAAQASVALRAVGQADLVVRADRARLRQVLRNIIENGLKYTRPGGAVTVSVDKNADRAVLCVRDSGVGIPAESLPHIFDEFVRVPGSRPGEGAGLGLAIVRRLVQAMGGRVWAVSTPGAGSSFFVELPLWTGEG